MANTRLNRSRKGYNKWFTGHEADVFMEEIEYYKVIGSLLKGKKSVDIGCGYGALETFSADTVGVDFSEKAIQIAKKRGIKHLVKAPAEKLPFKDNEFEVAVSIGVLEHVENIDKAIAEMVRVSEIQINVVHAALPYGLEHIKPLINKVLGYKDQPIEKPQSMKNLNNLFKKHGSRILIEGVWNYIDLRWIHKSIPYGIVKIPSHHFVVSIKTDNLDRKFLKELDFKTGL